MESKLTVKVGADIAELRKELKDAKGHLSSFQDNVSKAGAYLAASFSVTAVASFGKAILDTTAKFQKFEAVLTNTLGSNSEAKQALAGITDFASKTPFQVDELTGSFVKLVNQGFKPTFKEMTSLGDLAASQGKSFDQLTEAIIDAQTGEFERLKEFGVHASKEGDKVTFTFKGVKQQVDFTSESIREYILGLGSAAGVSGSMEAISKTLGGQISNLEDAFDQLKLAMGEAAESGGGVSEAIDTISKSIQGLTKVVKSKDFNWALQGAIQNATFGFKIWGILLDEAKKKLNEFKTENANEELRRLRDQLALAEADLKTWQETGFGNRNKILQQIADLSAQIKKFPTTEDPLPWVTDEKTKKIDAQTLALLRLQKAIGFKKDEPFNGDTTNPLSNGVTEDDYLNSVKKNFSDEYSGDPVPGIVAEADANEQLSISLYEVSEARENDIKSQERHAEEMKRHAEQMQHNTQVAANLGQVIGESFGEAAAGQKKFGAALKAMLPQIIKMLLAEAMASIVAAGAKQGAKSGNAILGVAAAAAGAAAIAALFNKAIGSGASADTGGYSATPSESKAQNMNVNVTGKLRGYDLMMVNGYEGFRRSKVG